MARHPGAVKRATSYAERLRLGIALIHGDHDKICESELDDGRNSPPPPEVETRTTAFTLGLEYLPGKCSFVFRFVKIFPMYCMAHRRAFHIHSSPARQQLQLLFHVS